MANQDRSERERLVLSLGERIKELTLLHRASRLLDAGRAPDAALLAELVVLVPAAWQFPETCEARIRWMDIEVRTPGWRETPWMQHASFGSGAETGAVDVAYREMPRVPSGEAFLKEEEELIASFAEMLGARFGRVRAEQRLREREQRLTFLFELSEATRAANGVEEILAIVVERLGRHLGVSRCAVARVEADGLRCSVLSDYTDGCASFVGPYDLTLFGADLLLKAKGPLFVRDVATEWGGNSRQREARQKNLELGVHAMIVASYVKNGTLRAIMAVQQTKPRDWSDYEVTLLAETVSRTWANIEQRAAEVKLRQNESLLRIAGEAARLGGWSLELPDRLTWSDEVCAIHEMPPGTIPTPQQALEFYAPEYRDTIIAAMDACTRDGEPFDLELEIVGAGGRRVWVRAIGRAERNAAGEIKRVQGAFQDVSGRKRLEEHLRQAQKMEAIGQLAASAAHDFNNMLSVILSYTAFVLDELQEGEPVRADVMQIQTAGTRAVELTRQLLTFGRQQALDARRLDLGEIVTGIEKMLNRLAGPRVQLSVRSAEPVGMVLVDQGQLEQAVVNLVVNARDAMANGGSITIEIDNVTLERPLADNPGVPPGRYVTLAVSDTGSGMDAATKARIFEPFFTTKERGKGTGLGLATTYGVVTQSGGSIHVRSQPGVGTTFILYLPRLDDDAPVVAPPETPRRTTLRGSETILLVEDSEQVRATARSALRRAGYTVLEAQNAGEAILICEQYEPKIHLLLTDVMMPHLSGAELAQRFTRARPETRVLCMSGSPDAAAELERLSTDVALLLKPFTPDTLLVKTREVLDATARAPSNALSGSTPTTFAGRGEHILLVDDEDALVRLTKRVLKRRGYRVTGFTSAAAALEAFQQSPDAYEAIVTDVTMPALSAFDLLREIRRMRPAIPIVLTAGYFRDEDVRSAAALDLRAMVVKPDTVEELGRALHDELRRLAETTPARAG